MIVLDTHAWVWWVAESKALSARAYRAIVSADEIAVSVIPGWELDRNRNRIPQLRSAAADANWRCEGGALDRLVPR